MLSAMKSSSRVLPLTSMLLSILFMWSALVGVESVKLESLANYSKPIASICIAIPPAGESYQQDSPPIKKSLTNSNVVHFGVRSEHEKDNQDQSPEESSSEPREAPHPVVVNDTWVLPGSSDPSLARASLQYYVKINGRDKPQFWAGETIIPNTMLKEGNHILTYEQVVQQDGRLTLKVWWNSEEMMFQQSSNRPVFAPLYEPSHVVFFGPPTLQKSDRALCYDDRLPAASIRDPQQTTLAIVGTCVLMSLLLVSLVALVLVRRHCKADSLNIAGHTAPEKEAADTVAGLTGGGGGAANYEASDNIAYQPVAEDE